MTEKTNLVISNYWHKPEILIKVKHDNESPNGSIHLEMGMNDFIAALAAELGNPLLIWTKAGQKADLVSAYERVIDKAKQTTNAVM